MKKLTVTIPITPVPKGRPRATICAKKGTKKGTKRGGIKFYTPKATAEYEKAIAEVWRQATKNFKYDREQPLYVNLVFGLPIAKSTPKGKSEQMAQGIIRHTKKPDADNLAKAVMDALNGVAWEDDSQVVRVSIFKEYAKEPYVYIYIHDDAE